MGFFTGIRRFSPGLAIGLVAAASSSALATGGLICKSPDGAVSVEMGIGSVPVAAVIGATITTPTSKWSTSEDASATRIAVGQDFRDSQVFQVDFTDYNVMEIIARLRLSRARQGEHFALAGTLAIEGVGAWPVVCEEGG